MLSPCSHNCGIPLIWKPGWIVVEPIDNILISSMILLNIKLVLETCVSIFFMPRSWSICLDERSDFLWFTCIWCKLPPWIRESLFLLLWNHPKSVMHMCEVFYGLETCNLHSICVPSTLSHWLTCSRKRSLCLGSNPWTCVKTSISSMMVPHLTRFCFVVRLLRGHACLGHHVHM